MYQMYQLTGHFYRPQRSWGKVIFSEACVKNSVHRGGGGGTPVCIAGLQAHTQGGKFRGLAWGDLQAHTQG